MSKEFHATYENGVLRPDQPLPIPDRARVAGFIVSVEDSPSREKLLDDDFWRELDELSIDAPTLPSDFSRADIYLDHD